MIQQVSILLHRPVEEVFAFITDAAKLGMWQSNLIESESLTAGPLRVGSRLREMRRLGRRPSEIRVEITEWEPNRRFSTKTLTAPYASVTYTFDAEENSTRLAYKFALQTSGVMRLLEPLITASIKRETESDFRTLKSLLEDQVSARSPGTVRADNRSTC